MANWIAGAIRHPGALHRQLGVPQGQSIPAGKLQHAAAQGGVLGRRARLAETLKGFHRMGGGPVGRGLPYLVGERGPELVVPRQAGQVLPHQALMRAAILAKLQALARGGGGLPPAGPPIGGGGGGLPPMGMGGMR
jgi:hypothetical protein